MPPLGRGLGFESGGEVAWLALRLLPRRRFSEAVEPVATEQPTPAERLGAVVAVGALAGESPLERPRRNAEISGAASSSDNQGEPTSGILGSRTRSWTS